MEENEAVLVIESLIEEMTAIRDSLIELHESVNNFTECGVPDTERTRELIAMLQELSDEVEGLIG